jgi:hypothetical protein
MLFDKRAQCVAVFPKYLNWSDLKGNKFLEQLVTCDEMWVHYFTPLSKLSSMACITRALHHQKIHDTAVSWYDNGKCLLGFRRRNHAKFLQHGLTIMTQHSIQFNSNYLNIPLIFNGTIE